MGAVGASGEVLGLLPVVGLVFSLFLVRVYGVAQFATLLALGGGLGAPGVLALRAASDLLLAAVLCWGVERWLARHDGAAPGRPGRALARLRSHAGRGGAFGSLLAAGYCLNSYLVFALVPLLPHRRRALAGALAGDLGAFVVELLALLGLSTVLGGSPAALGLGLGVLTLALTGLTHLLRRRLRAAGVAVA